LDSRGFLGFFEKILKPSFFEAIFQSCNKSTANQSYGAWLRLS